MLNHSAIENVRLVRRRFSWALFWWSIGSMVIGLPMWIWHTPFIGSMGSQFFIWGAIDIFFAWMGVSQSRKVDGTPIDDAAVSSEIADARKALGAIKFNRDVLNWIWLITGLVLLAWGLIARSNVLIGHGVGVTIQGGFLFGLDRQFYRRLNAAVDETADEHR